LKALGGAATRLREKLGESLASVQKFDAPLENVTTASLQALQAYSLGHRARTVKGDPAAAIPFFQRGVDLDPNFAMAYIGLGDAYSNLGETVRAADTTRKAYALRDRVSEREKLSIASQYESYVTGNLEAARKAYELWAETYPRDDVPPTNLGYVYEELGEYDKSLAAAQRALELNPGSGVVYGILMDDYMNLNRLDKARNTGQQAVAHHVSDSIRLDLYLLAFLQHDSPAMQRESAAVRGKPGIEDPILYYESDTAAYAGQFSKARELTRRAVASAQRADEKEVAAGYQAEAALREALVGNTAFAQQEAQSVLALPEGRDVEAVSGTALGLTGDSGGAVRVAGDLAKRFPEDTLVKFNYSPSIHAAAALGRSRTAKDADQAIQALAAATPYELGSPVSSFDFNLYPIYLRGHAYLAARRGAAAAAQFQKIFDHPGVVVNEPIGSLAHLGLARAYALTGDTAKSRTAYQDFFAIWNDADPDIPILKAAKAEYAKLP
ncbi:MAG: tetratricopeptide repeat protein, partial [Bryobacteraceae bacterium]